MVKIKKIALDITSCSKLLHYFIVETGEHKRKWNTRASGVKPPQKYPVPLEKERKKERKKKVQSSSDN